MPFHHMPSICPYVICLPYALCVIKLPSYGFHHVPFKWISRRTWHCYSSGPFATRKGTTQELQMRRGGSRKEGGSPWALPLIAGFVVLSLSREGTEVSCVPWVPFPVFIQFSLWIVREIAAVFQGKMQKEQSTCQRRVCPAIGKCRFCKTPSCWVPERAGDEWKQPGVGIHGEEMAHCTDIPALLMHHHGVGGDSKFPGIF